MTSGELTHVKPARERSLKSALEKIGVETEKIIAAAEGRIADEDVDATRLGESGFDE